MVVVAVYPKRDTVRFNLIIPASKARNNFGGIGIIHLAGKVQSFIIIKNSYLRPFRGLCTFDGFQLCKIHNRLRKLPLRFI